MALRKRKSIQNIENQRTRLAGALSSKIYNARTKEERERYMTLRDRMIKAADRYVGNIKNSRSYQNRENDNKRSWAGDDRFTEREMDKRLHNQDMMRGQAYSQNTYMGLNEG